MANFDLKNQAMLKIALSVLLAVVLVGVFLFTRVLPFGYLNVKEQIDGLEATCQKKSTELARAKAAVADLPRFEAEYAMLHERWTMAAELLPTDRQLAALLRKITLAGQQTGVQFVMFKPNPPKTQPYYVELPVEVSVFGGYHQVGSFLAELANMQRIVTVSNVKLTTNTKGDVLATTGASLTASAYSLSSTSAAPAPKPVATPEKGVGNARKDS